MWHDSNENKNTRTRNTTAARLPELARLCSALNASAAACQDEEELRKRAAAEGMLRFGYEHGYLRNRTLNDVNL